MPTLPQNITTQEALLSSVAEHSMALVRFEDFVKIFQGRNLDAVEHEFRKEFFSRTGQTHLKHGRSREDKLLAFCTEHHLSLRMLKEHYLFFRGRVDVESFVNSDL